MQWELGSHSCNNVCCSLEQLTFNEHCYHVAKNITMPSVYLLVKENNLGSTVTVLSAALEKKGEGSEERREVR